MVWVVMNGRVVRVGRVLRVVRVGRVVRVVRVGRVVRVVSQGGRSELSGW